MKVHRFLWAVLLIALLSLVGVLMFSFGGGKGVQNLSEIRDQRYGSGYVLARYNGLLNGWDVAFFHRNSQGEFVGYYLAHESSRWRNVELEIQRGAFMVRKGNEIIAEFNPQTGTFNHKYQRHIYSKQDGLDGGLEAGKWGLTVR